MVDYFGGEVFIQPIIPAHRPVNGISMQPPLFTYFANDHFNLNRNFSRWLIKGFGI